MFWSQLTWAELPQKIKATNNAAILPIGVTGKPSISCAEKGEQWFQWMVEDLSALIQKGMVEQPPLQHAYFDSYSSREPQA